MKSKPTFLVVFMLVLLLVYQIIPALSDIVESELKSFVVERRSEKRDKFTVNMKSGHTCATNFVELSNLCTSYGGFLKSFTKTPSSCSCVCWYSPFTFLLSIQKCATQTLAANFGGCDEYLEELSLLVKPKQPLDLTQASSASFSATQATSCTFNQTYLVYDYSGFQSRWNAINDTFFSLTNANTNGKFYIHWKSDSNETLSGRIIRIPVTCTKGNSFSTPCILLKAEGTVTYSAPSPSVSLSSLPLTKTTSSSLSLSLSLLPPPLSSSPSFVPTTHSAVSPSSIAVQSSFSLYQPVSSPVLLTSSALSPSPSLTVVISSTGSLGVPQSVSSFLSSTQSQTTKLSTLTAATGISHQSSGGEVKPFKTTATAVSSSSATNVSPAGDKQKRKGENKNGIVIGAAVGGALVLGILVIMSILVWKRRKSGKNIDKQGKTVNTPDKGSSGNEIQLEIPNDRTSPTAQEDQPTYQGLVNENRQSKGAAIYSSAEGNHDNCTVYQTLDKENPGSPVYLGLSKGLPEGAPTTGIPNSKHTTMPNPKLKPSAGGIPSSKANGTIGVLKSNSATGQPKRGPSVPQEPVYNVLDGPGTGPRTTTEPLYVFEGHEYATPNVDPLYNVLEGPDSNRIVPKSGPNTSEEAVYNVLEGPNTTKGPANKQGTENDAIYNVLEAPDSDKNSLVAQGHSGPGDEPLYSVLDEQAGDAPNKSSSLGGVANPAYEQTLDFDASYAAVRIPGSRGESLYEPLRRPGQDVYEPLG